MATAKINVIVVFGGKSTEHEISCRSATFILKNLDRNKFNVFPLGISKSGEWQYFDIDNIIYDENNVVKISPESRTSFKPIESNPLSAESLFLKPFGIKDGVSHSVVFPIVHGTNGEDGRLQGILETVGIPFVGCSAMASAIAMDKSIAKKLVQAAGVDVVPWVEFQHYEFDDNQEKIISEIEVQLGYPSYVKPATLGSSVGISRTSNRVELIEGIRSALKFDGKILVEKAVRAKEIECAAMGYSKVLISHPGEIMTKEDAFYSYDAKYIDAEAALIKIPADISDEKTKEVMDKSRIVFKELNLSGFSRIDFFLELKTEKYYFNEANTIPGFTSISQFPSLWKAEGREPHQLLEELIEYAIERHQFSSELLTSI